MRQDIILKGRNIQIRDWNEKDFDIYLFYRRPEHKWHQFDGPYYPRKSKEEIEEYLNVVRTKIKNKTFETLRNKMVIANNNDDKFIGLVNSYWESKETNWLSIGIGIYDDSLWGKGIGQEALTLWINYLFDNHKEIARLDLRTWSGNIGMMKLAEKLGFKQEACFRKARIVEGKYYDSLGYGILREEWKHR